MMDERELISSLDEAAAALEVALEGKAPTIGLILGSGLGPLAEEISPAVTVPFAEVPHMKTSTATGHVGRFVIGSLGGARVITMQGRLHGYEGNSAQEVAFPVWLMERVGVRTLIVTNAAGAINPSYQPGEFCLMRDHINFTGRNPVAGLGNETLAPRFFSMKDAYDPHLRKVALECARDEGVTLHEGVYLGLLGPSFETPAEIEAFSRWGADSVAMSVVEEVIAARYVGMRVMGISLLSNMACGVGDADPSDQEVFEVAARAEADLCRLMTRIVGCI